MSLHSSQSAETPYERTRHVLHEKNKVVVIGAGIAGLVSALLLSHAGAQVIVLEAQEDCGGKLRQLRPGDEASVDQQDWQGIDSGPTVLTMKWVFEEIFESLGLHLDQELSLTQLDVLARHAWGADEGANQLTLYADGSRSEEAVAEFAGASEARRFKSFCKSAKSLYDSLEGAIIREPAPSMKKLAFSLGPRGLATLASIGPMKSLWDSLGGYFNDPRLRQLFARYATYCGSSPWSAPATLMLIAQVEMDGVWSIKGGMKALAQTLEKLAKQRGVTFKYKSPCTSIEVSAGAVKAVLTNEERIEANAVLFNGDIQALCDGLLGSDVESYMRNTQSPKAERSLSAVTWSMRCEVEESHFKLDRHNVFFQNHYENEFKDIFQSAQLPALPTVYVCAQERGLAGGALSQVSQTSKQSLFCLVNAPANGDRYQFTPKELEACERATFSLLKRCGLQIKIDPSAVIQTLPQHFHRLFPATGGALYGQATHGWMQVFSRSTARTPIQGLFLAGGSVHPGPGLPMAAMSARLAAGAVMDHLGLTKR
jgi:1-hydroxycarotenoid 3,4-desaturase